MPKAPVKKPPVAPVAPTPPPAPTPVVAKRPMKVKYPLLEVEVFSITSPKGPLDVAWMKDAMGWETESEYRARKVRENPGTTPEKFPMGDGVALEGGGIQPVHCTNVAGEKVICWHNAHNRPFDDAWSEDIEHTVLVGQWAGPHTMPGETVNGETIRISRYGQVLSGQHSMTGAIRADEKLKKARAELGREAADRVAALADWIESSLPLLLEPAPVAA